ncbi:MAG: carbamate kinase [Planctomycetota bacterium]|nr:MAG: carbamate kinase [Planctomycetota bacterium]
MSLITIVAIGGNALVDPKRPPTVENQNRITEMAVKPIADLIEKGEQILLVHGNGPQVGFLALRSTLARDKIHEVPLDALVADTQGSLGYMIERCLRNELQKRRIHKEVVTVVTEIRVDPKDPAFQNPTKPIGIFYTEEEARELQKTRGWTLMEDAGRGWRRVVPSPKPLEILQIESIQTLVDAGYIVIACGGGGIPIVRENGIDRGIEGVIDKDLASALLGKSLGARTLFLTTGVDYIYKDFQTSHPVPLREISISELEVLEKEGQFPPGSMGPKIEGARQFLEGGGKEVFICKPENLLECSLGKVGTKIYG